LRSAFRGADGASSSPRGRSRNLLIVGAAYGLQHLPHRRSRLLLFLLATFAQHLLDLGNAFLGRDRLGLGHGSRAFPSQVITSGAGEQGAVVVSVIDVVGHRSVDVDRMTGGELDFVCFDLAFDAQLQWKSSLGIDDERFGEKLREQPADGSAKPFSSSR